MKFGINISEEILVILGDNYYDVIKKLDDNSIEYRVLSYKVGGNTNDSSIIRINELNIEILSDNNVVNCIRSKINCYVELIEIGSCSKITEQIRLVREALSNKLEIPLDNMFIREVDIHNNSLIITVQNVYIFVNMNDNKAYISKIIYKTGDYNG